MKKTILLSIVVLLVTLASAPAETRLVPAEYATIQDAIDAAVDGDVVIVALGIYTGDGNRDIDFRGKGITVQSVDPNDPTTVAATIIDCNGIFEEPHRGFYFHSGEDCNSVLSGLTITNGYAGYGGGIECVSSHPTIANCTFLDNTGQYWYGGQYGTLTPHENRSSMVNDDGEVHINIPPPLPGWRGMGGGIYCRWMSSPTLTNCKFIGNSAYEYGGGIYMDYNSNPILTNCTFTSNTALYGGAMNSYFGNPILFNCIFNCNSAELTGGAMQNANSSSRLYNCIFKGNTAGWNGGCLSNYGSNLILTNCTFSKNSAVNGGVIFNSGSDATLSNCILWGNTATEGNEIYLDFYTDFLGNKISSTINVDYSNVEGGAAGVYVDTDCTLNWGTGNIEADPCFVETGYWDSNGVWIEGDYHLLAGSPCIDAGDPNYVAEPNETDLDGKPRVIGGRIDMGAYEYGAVIPAEARIVPRTINLASKGNWITCYIWLPEQFNVADIDPNSVFLEEQIKAEEFLVDEQKQVAIARFNREELRGIISTGEVELTITGQLKDGTIFEATDVIKVVNEGRRKN
jgi:parallel beta-helix repeat protein